MQKMAAFDECSAEGNWEVFKDPAKRKVMHGADRDIMWFQRDFGIYIYNLFDTGQASIDWRLRPLPEEMVRYAREDTHYMLHMYDLMRTMFMFDGKGIRKLGRSFSRGRGMLTWIFHAYLVRFSLSSGSLIFRG
ncbi:hypothetical protein GBA52_010079 [Prunus armeniaca]|nr:hypothetical protein GBA52_010079 [Prunus armeniaca]